jgi:uncharacterized DUF497 family protein
MSFEWDEGKSRKNREKHGIGFEQVEKLWLSDLTQLGPKCVDIGNGQNEDRYLVIGTIEDMHWTAVITYRDDRVRIISCRRSRKDEVMLYDKY